MPEIRFVPETSSQLRQRFDQLRQATAQLRKLSNAKMFRLLDEVGQLWRPDGPYFPKALELLKGSFSEPAVRAALTNLSLSLNGELVEAELRRELGRADLLETWQADEHRIGHVRGYPLGVVAQVLAGNVFLNGIVGLSQCLLTRNAALLKLSQRDSGLTELFVQSLREADREGLLRDAIAICAWHREQKDFHQVLREEADAIVVWGGESAIAAYPQHACRGKVVRYGPRLGIGIVAEGLDLESGLPQLAWDVALWEQKACSSPRILFVEDRNQTGDFPRKVAYRLSETLSRIGDHIPPQPLSLDDKAEVLSIREFADWQQHAIIFTPERSMSHTVLLFDDLPSEVPVGYRTVMIVPIPKMRNITEKLKPYREMLQTAVLAAPPARWPDLVDELVVAGISQVTAPGSAAARFLGLPHEGEFALRRLVKLVGVDLGIGPLTCPDRSASHLADISEAFSGSQ